MRYLKPIVLAALLVGSVLIRIAVMPHFLHGFRETQTAETVLWYNQEGIALIDYQTPIFGPPWQVPMEFPTHQVLAAALARWGMDTGTACRYSSLFFFYLSALPLCLIVRRHFKDPDIAIWTLLVYLWTPYNIGQSISGLIDPCALAFVFGYFYCFLVWLDNRRVLPLVACVFCGVMGGITKVTMVSIMIIPFSAFTVNALKEEYCRGVVGASTALDSSCARRWNVRRVWLWFGMAAIAIVPFLAIYAWTTYGDLIKARNPFTRHLTSVNLREWNFGFPGQKLKLENWIAWLKLWQELLAPGFTGCFGVVAVAGIWRASLREKIMLLAAVLGCLCAMGIFFNLYRHPYYYISFSPFTAVLIGYGMNEICHKMPLMTGYVISALIWMSTGPAWHSLNLAKDYNAGQGAIRRVGAVVQKVTTPSDWVISEQPDWYSDILYHSKRRGLIVCGQSLAFGGAEALDDALKDPRFSTLVTTERESQLLRKWSYHRMVYSNYASRLFVYEVNSGKKRLSSKPVEYILTKRLQVTGGNPYAEVTLPVDLTLDPRKSYRIEVAYRTEGAAKPFVIMIGGGCELKNLPLHEPMILAPSGGTFSAEFCIPYDSSVKEPSLVVRNWSIEGAVTVDSIRIWAE